MTTGNPTILGVDVGYGNVKWHGVLPWDNTRFRSGHFPAIAVDAQQRLMMANYGRALDLRHPVVNGRKYYVGRDVALMLKQPTAAPLDKQYPLTDDYHALLLGALAEADLAELDLLVLGLSGRYFADMALKQALYNKFVGEHIVGDLRVNVRRIHVVPQPVGGLASWANYSDVWQRMKNQEALIVDAGYNSLDWCVFKQRAVMPQYTSSKQGGMAHFVDAIREVLDRSYPNVHLRGVHQIDEALRGERHIMEDGKLIDLQPIIDAALPVWDRNLTNMVRMVQGLRSYDGVYVVGGGAQYIAGAIERRYPGVKPMITPDAQPFMANVRGFVIAGLKLMHTEAAPSHEHELHARLRLEPDRSAPSVHTKTSNHSAAGAQLRAVTPKNRENSHIDPTSTSRSEKVEPVDAGAIERTENIAAVDHPVADLTSHEPRRVEKSAYNGASTRAPKWLPRPQSRRFVVVKVLIEEVEAPALFTRVWSTRLRARASVVRTLAEKQLVMDAVSHDTLTLLRQ